MNMVSVTKEAFDEALASPIAKFLVVVQVCPALQKFIRISRQEAIWLAEDAFRFGDVWGHFNRELIEFRFGPTHQDMVRNGMYTDLLTNEMVERIAITIGKELRWQLCPHGLPPQVESKHPIVPWSNDATCKPLCDACVLDTVRNNIRRGA